MPHIYTSRFLKDIPYTETQFAEAFNYIFQKKIDYTISGSNITINSFGVFADGYFIIGVGSAVVNVTQNGYLIIEYQRNETLNTEVFSSVYYSATIPASTSVNKYGVLGEVVVDYSGMLKFYPRVTQRLEEDTKRFELLWTGSVVDSNPMPILLSSYPQYDYFIGYVETEGYPIPLEKNFSGAVISGSHTNLFVNAPTAFTTVALTLPYNSLSLLGARRQVHNQNGNNSAIASSRITAIRGVKL